MADIREKEPGGAHKHIRPAVTSLLPTTTAQNPTGQPLSNKAASFHPAIYIISWISLSSSVILFNKWILHTVGFQFPLFLTTWHLVFATIMTQFMARYTKMLDSRHSVPMTRHVYLRTVVPIGIFFSLSLICGNMTYLYLSVSFIQMLKATNVVATLLTTWAMGLAPPNIKTLGNVSFIVLGVVIASIGEIKFHLVGFLYQVAGIIFEAIRLVLVQRLLSSTSEFKMDPLVSLYYFAPACAVMNGLVTLVVEVPRLTMGDLYKVGLGTLLGNAGVAFLLNISVVFLIGKTSAVVLTLSGVVKDIMLVVASMIIFGDPVTSTQVFGYGIALSGLVYYKLGGEEKVKMFFGRFGGVGGVGGVDSVVRVPRRVATIGIALVGMVVLCMFFWVYEREILERVG